MVKKVTTGTSYEQSRINRKKILTLLLAVFTVIFAFSSYKVFTILSNYNESESEYSDIKDKAVQETEREDLPSNPGHKVKVLDIDYQSLKEQNPDYCAWIDILNNDKISYPVMRSKDNDFYLHRTFEKKYLFAGSLFMDYRNNADFSSPVTFIYGHSMNNRSMFGSLRNYRTQSYYDEHRIIHLYVDGQLYVYKVFAFIDTVPYSKIYKFKFESDQAIKDYIALIQSSSMYKSDMTVTSDQKILCLSTCNTDNKRWILAAVLTNVIDL